MLWSVSTFLGVEFSPLQWSESHISVDKLSQFSSNYSHCNSQCNYPELQFQAALDGVAVMCS